MSMLYADLAIPISVDRLFTYLVPEKLHQSAQCGARALAPFGGRNVVGIIVKLSPDPPDFVISSERGRPGGLRTILGIKSIYPALSALTARGYVQVQEEVRALGFGPKFESIIRVDDARRAEWALWLANAPSSVPRQQSVIRELLSKGNGASIP